MDMRRRSVVFTGGVVLALNLGAAGIADSASRSQPVFAVYLDTEQTDKQKLDAAQAGEMRALALFDRQYKAYSARMRDLFAANQKAAAANDQAALFAATQQMQETQMSFNLQYLQLQNSMQNDNRQFTMVSNIMKTKHDTAKNSITNIR